MDADLNEVKADWDKAEGAFTDAILRKSGTKKRDILELARAEIEEILAKATNASNRGGESWPAAKSAPYIGCLISQKKGNGELVCRFGMVIITLPVVSTDE